MELDIKCPISYEIMTDPVILVETGQTYERSNILRWFDSSMSDPITGSKLKNDACIIPNIIMRQYICNLGHSIKTDINNTPLILKNRNSSFNDHRFESLDSNINLVTNLQFIEETYPDIRVRHNEITRKYENILYEGDIIKLQKQRDEEIDEFFRN